MADENHTTDAWDGLPPTPDAAGWHWLRPVGGGRVEPWFWHPVEGWECDSDGSPESMRFMAYVAPCPAPEEISNVPG